LFHSLLAFDPEKVMPDVDQPKPDSPEAILRHDPYAALREPNFRWFLAGNVLSMLGLQMQTYAVGWEIYERTHSAMALGYAGLAQFLEIECMNASRRRNLMHVLQMLAQQRMNLRASQVVKIDLQVCRTPRKQFVLILSDSSAQDKRRGTEDASRPRPEAVTVKT
jgi:hypothetical protein